MSLLYGWTWLYFEQSQVLALAPLLNVLPRAALIAILIRGTNLSAKSLMQNINYLAVFAASPAYCTLCVGLN